MSWLLLITSNVQDPRWNVWGLATGGADAGFANTRAGKGFWYRWLGAACVRNGWSQQNKAITTSAAKQQSAGGWLTGKYQPNPGAKACDVFTATWVFVLRVKVGLNDVEAETSKGIYAGFHCRRIFISRMPTWICRLMLMPTQRSLWVCNLNMCCHKLSSEAEYIKRLSARRHRIWVQVELPKLSLNVYC